MQEDLNLFEASEDADEEFYAGGGQYRRHGLEHFPQLWCQNGSYSVYGQVRRSSGAELAVTLISQRQPNSIAMHPGALGLHACHERLLSFTASTAVRCASARGLPRAVAL